MGGMETRWPAPLSPQPLVQERPEIRGRPWRLLVVCVLCNRTRGEDAYSAALELFSRWPTVEAMAGADPGAIEPLIWHLGLHRQRSRSLVRLSQRYLEGSWESVTELHGCGGYAADAWAIFVEGCTDVWPRDGHLNRYVAWRVEEGTWGNSRPMRKAV